MEELKTLANCSNVEFMRQANKIRKAVSKYLKDTKVLDIAKIRTIIPEDATDEKKRELAKEQYFKNVSDILDSVLDENAEATVAILGLMCFKEGKEVDELSPADLLTAALDMLANERVMSFFIKLKNSGLMNMADI